MYMYVLIYYRYLVLFADEVNDIKETLTAAQNQTKDLQDEIGRLKTENDDIKTAAAISEASKEDDIEVIQRKCQEELASLQHIMKGNRIVVS